MSKTTPSAQSRSQLSELRRLLRSEAAALLKDLQRVAASHQARMEQCLKKLERGDDAEILAELSELRSVLEAARRGLDRMGMASQSADKLRTEWNDWEQHAGFVEDSAHATKRARQEMIASELRLRGIRLPSGRSVEVEVVSAAPEPVEAPETVLVAALPVEMVSDDVEEEDGRFEYWESLVAATPPESTEEETLARILGAYRVVQGEQKKLDRAKGVRRYRLGAFDAWH